MIRQSLLSIPAGMVRKDNYPGLPKELQEFNYYISDSGHCLMMIPKCLLGEAIKSGNWFDYEVPCPVKYVLEKGYCIENGFLICDAPFDCDDNDWCLDVDEEYYDYLNPPSVNESVTNTLAWKEFTRISPTLSQRLKKTPNADLSTEGILDYLWGGYSFFGNKEFLSLYEHMKQFTMENGHKANL